MVTLIIVIASLTCLVAAAILALRLIPVTGAATAWTIIAASVLLMVVRRTVVLFGLIRAGDSDDFLVELIGLGVAVLLLAGMAGIAPVLRKIQQSAEELRKAREELERKVGERTAELAAANQTLRMEILQRERVEAALADDQRQLRRLLEMYERDRKLAAYEIHDGFVQEAVAALMNLQACQHLAKTSPEEAAVKLCEATDLVADSIAEARSLISGLRPAILDELGLLPAVEQMVCDAVKRTSTAIEWSHHVDFQRLPAPLETGLFRIVQESLNNALRHSGSGRVRIDLSQVDRSLHITVQDWGRGFDPRTIKAGRFGIEGIRERARLFGGEACIESTPGSGTQVFITLPVPEPDPAETPL
jgi:signal transduction histidine kinase